ncbi:hypothetical protein [Croceicoccus sp. BE223]|uniref:hypothetical protein n=1 Tax=Croceicoccus sp. BE223 TaxID=2817716 RepID=UPI0028604498|nr:hypothetical protein [Croceicoccus sp. BE223]MDR7103985.1 hypothetical protein [Croceicoccus sp. BE223]
MLDILADLETTARYFGPNTSYERAAELLTFELRALEPAAVISSTEMPFVTLYPVILGKVSLMTGPWWVGADQGQKA